MYKGSHAGGEKPAETSAVKALVIPLLISL